MAQKYLDMNGLTRYHEGLLDYMSEAVGTQADMSVTDPTNMAYINNVPEWVRSETKPEYNATEVGADATGTAHTEMSNHDVSETAHEDIRNLIQEINTQIEESTWDDKYTKEEVDEKDATTLASAKTYADASSASALEDAKEYNDSAYANANAYTDQKIADLINGAPTTLDTLGEIATAMADNEDVVEALDEAIGKKADQTELDAHTGNNTIHITADERTAWNNKANASDLANYLPKDGTAANAAKVNGLTVETAVPANAKFTDTKVTVSAHAPTTTTNYYPVMHTSTSGTTAVTANAGIKFQTLTGTASANGLNSLVLGNGTASGTAGNAYGQIYLYGTGSYHTSIVAGAQTATRTITLPDASGTVALTSHTHSYMPTTPASIEFGGMGSSAGHGGFLDFHYNGSSSDHTSRIIESASGTLNLNGVTVTTGKVVTATSFAGSGASLTSLNASNISSGTLSVARGGTGKTTVKDAFSALSKINSGGDWKAAPTGISAWKYEGNDVTTYSLPNNCCFILVMKESNNRGTALALGWTTGTYTMWRSVLHDDSGSNKWSAWSIPPQAASAITAGTFGATGVVAATGMDYTTNRIRNQVFTTTDPGAGATTSYANGSIICVYE